MFFHFDPIFLFRSRRSLIFVGRAFEAKCEHVGAATLDLMTNEPMAFESQSTTHISLIDA